MKRLVKIELTLTVCNTMYLILLCLNYSSCVRIQLFFREMAANVCGTTWYQLALTKQLGLTGGTRVLRNTAAQS